MFRFYRCYDGRYCGACHYNSDFGFNVCTAVKWQLDYCGRLFCAGLNKSVHKQLSLFDFYEVDDNER